MATDKMLNQLPPACRRFNTRLNGCKQPAATEILTEPTYNIEKLPRLQDPGPGLWTLHSTLYDPTTLQSSNLV